MELFHDVEFWIAVSFVLAMAVAWQKGKQPILSGLDARATKIKEELEEARRLREEAESTLASYQLKQRDALAEAQQIIANAQADAEQFGKQAALDLEVALKRREEQSVEKIAQAEQKALAEVRNLAVDVAIEATRAVLVQVLDAKRSAALIDHAIDDLPKRLH
ncbi:MAG TPA: F0F1 ATP synthase subunit B [Stellaceae bacterium]|nr:F0F1 ATP synthase subunit B [Stellaceae bacterium]